MMRPTLVAVADTLAAVALALWIGGHAALGAFAARVLFRDLPRPMASSGMTTVFREFDVLLIVAMVVVAAALVARVATLGWRTRADRIVAGAQLALLALGGFEVAYVHPRIEQLFQAGRTLEPAFASLHKLSARCGNLEVLLMVAVFAAQACGRKRV